MRGVVFIKAGRYRLSSTQLLRVCASDAGTVISVEDSQNRRRYTAVVDEHGKLVWPQAAHPQAEPEAAAPTTPAPPYPPPSTPIGRHSALPAQARPSRRLPITRCTWRKSLNIKFTLRYTHRARPRNIGRVLGGYRNGERVYVLYRICGGGDGRDGIMMLLPDNYVYINGMVPGADCVPEEKWDFFLSLPARATIKLRRCWQKMSEDELRALIGGRTFIMKKRRVP